MILGPRTERTCVDRERGREGRPEAGQAGALHSRTGLSGRQHVGAAWALSHASLWRLLRGACASHDRLDEVRRQRSLALHNHVHVALVALSSLTVEGRDAFLLHSVLHTFMCVMTLHMVLHTCQVVMMCVMAKL